MSLFDLNVQNYSVRELLDFFGLTKNDDAAEVDRKCRGLKQKISKDPKLGDVTKGKMHDFLNKATQRLSQTRHATAEIFGGHGNSGNGNSGNGNSGNGNSGNGNSGLNDVTEHGDTFLITRPSNKSVIEQNAAGMDKGGKSILSGAPPGRLNRLAISTIKRALNVDTRFRTNYYTTKSTDFVLSIPYKFENVTSMSVASYELPLTYYAISQQYENNCILFQWESTPTDPTELPNYDKEYLMIIPDGNYRAAYQSGGGAIIETTINGILAGTELSKQTGMAFTTDSTSGRSIFSCNSAIDASGNVLPQNVFYTGAMRIVFNVTGELQQDGSNFFFKFQSDSRALPLFFGWKLGFRTAAYEMRGDTRETVLPQSAVSEGICQISGPQYLFLCIDDYNNSVNNYYVSAYGSSTISPNIIARLNIKQQINAAGAYGLAGGESLTTSLTYSREYFGPVDIQRMRITLVDDFGRVLDLNNMDWSFSLMFECVYSSSSA
jgi:hypothetical protein